MIESRLFPHPLTNPMPNQEVMDSTVSTVEPDKLTSGPTKQTFDGPPSSRPFVQNLRSMFNRQSKGVLSNADAPF